MTDFRNNSVPLASGRRAPASRAVAPGYAGAASVPLASSAGRVRSGARTEHGSSYGSYGAHGGARRVPVEQARRYEESHGHGPAGAQQHTRAAAGGRAEGRRTTRRSTNFMKYAADNRFVRAVYGFVTGPTKTLFIVLVLGAVAVSLYFPVRDYYAAWRTNDILSRQVALREAYNDELEADVDRYLSQEGIEEAARSELGMVLPGETRVEVTGGSDSSDGDGDNADANAGASSGQDGDADDAADANGGVPATAAEAKLAEEQAAQEAPWYIKALDVLFFFNGVEGQKVSSTGGN